MRKILFIVGFVFSVFSASAQTLPGYTLVNGKWQYVYFSVQKGLGIPNDTLSDAPIYGLAVKGSTLYTKLSTGVWVSVGGSGGGGVWGFVGGDINAQADLQTLVAKKYDTTKRFVDTLYVTNDTTIVTLNKGLLHTYKIRGAVPSFNGRAGNIILTQADVDTALGYAPSNLPNVTNLLQVVNAGGAVSIQTGFYSARPSPGTYGRFYLSVDSARLEFDNGTSWQSTGSGSGGGAGTVTAVIKGYGLLPGTITTSGTVVVDSATLAIYFMRRGDSGVSYITPLQLSLKEPLITAANTVNKYWNGYKQFVGLNTDSVFEGTTNKFFTNTRARSSISVTHTGSGDASYDNTTGVINIPTNSSGTDSSISARRGIKDTIVGTTRYLESDTSYMVRMAHLYYALDSLNATIVHYKDSAGTTGFAKFDRLYKVRDSIMLIINAALGAKVDTSAKANIRFRGKGQPGDTAYVFGRDSTIWEVAQRDSAGRAVHHKINPDSSWTWYNDFFNASQAGIVAGSGTADHSKVLWDDGWGTAPSGGSSIDTTSLFKYLSDSNRNNKSYYTVGRGNKLADSLSALIALKLSKSDSNQTVNSWASVGRINKIADSLANLFLKKVDSSQTIHSWASIGRLNKIADSLGALISGGGTDTAERFLGVIFKSNNFSSLSSFTNNGSATFTVSGGKINASGGSGLANWSNSLDYNYFTGANKWKQSFRVTTATKAAGVGWSIGIRSTNTYVASNISVQFDGSNDAGSGKFYLYTTSGGVTNTKVDSTGAIAFTAGDDIVVTFEQNETFINVTAKNFTTNSGYVQAWRGYTFGTASDVLANTGKFSFFQHGGANVIDSICISSQMTKYPSIVILGDSRLYGDYAGDYSATIAGDLERKYGSVVNLAKAGDRTGDILNRVPEALSIHADQAVVMAGINDISSGVDSFTIKSNIASIDASLTAAGITVWHLLPFYSSTTDQAWLAKYIIRTYPHYIDTYTPTVNCSTCLVDGVHYNAFGNKLLAQAIIDTNVLIKKGTILRDTAYVVGNIPPQTNAKIGHVTFGTSNNVIAGLPGFVYDPVNFRMGINGQATDFAPAATLDLVAGTGLARQWKLFPSSGGDFNIGTVTIFKNVNGLNFNSAFMMGLDNSSLTHLYLGSGGPSEFHIFDPGGIDTYNMISALSRSTATFGAGAVYGGASNTGGGTTTIQGGRGSGTGVPGDIIFTLSDAVGSGTAVQSLTNYWWMKGASHALSNKSTPDASATFDLTGTTTKGFLPPVLTTTQQTAISSPATGLMIFNSDSLNYCVYNGTAWRMVSYTATGSSFSTTAPHTWTNTQDMTGATVTVANQSSNNNSANAANTAYVDAAILPMGGTNYIPTATSTTNIASSSIGTCFYHIFGGAVAYIIHVQVTPSSASTFSTLTVSLPVTTSHTSQGIMASGQFVSSGGTQTLVYGAIASGTTATLNFTSPAGTQVIGDLIITLWYRL